MRDLYYYCLAAKVNTSKMFEKELGRRNASKSTRRERSLKYCMNVLPFLSCLRILHRIYSELNQVAGDCLMISSDHDKKLLISKLVSLFASLFVWVPAQSNEDATTMYVHQRSQRQLSNPLTRGVKSEVTKS